MFKKQSVARKKKLNNQDDKQQSINIITQLILYKLKSKNTQGMNNVDKYNLIETIITNIYNSINDPKKHGDLNKYKIELEILFPILTPRTIQKSLLYVLSLKNDGERQHFINHVLSIYKHYTLYTKSKKTINQNIHPTINKSRKRKLIRDSSSNSKSSSSIKKLSKKKKKIISSSSYHTPSQI